MSPVAFTVCSDTKTKELLGEAVKSSERDKESPVKAVGVRNRKNESKRTLRVKEFFLPGDNRSRASKKRLEYHST